MSSNTTPSLSHRKIISGALTRTELRTDLYHYDKLEGRNDIRLVVLPPGSFYSSLRCDIIHVDLAEAPDYEALSYTWADENGDKSLTGAISCEPEDKRIPITRNCEAALRHLRLESETRVLWIDAICINQSMLEERNQQVSIMSKIYSTASRVVVYLGEATRDSDEFINFLNNKIEAQISSAQVKQANSMLRREWFKRLWVLQEIMLARRAVLMCGDKMVSWRMFADFCDTYHHRTYHSNDKHAQSDNVSFPEMLLHYGLRGAQPIERLPWMFCATQGGKASDPRDKVFALLGIVEKDSHPQMVPDYGLSSKKTFEDLATYFVRRFGIVFPSFSSEGSSWVYDWLDGTPRKPIHVGNEAFVQDTESGSNRLIIRGKRVISGFVRLIDCGTWKGLKVDNGVTSQLHYKPFQGFSEYQTEEVLVSVSECYCVILQLRSCHYEILSGTGALQKCESHGNDGQCGSECSPKEIKLKHSEDFSIA